MINLNQKEKIFFPNLDCLRFIAFSLVFLCHISESFINDISTLGELPKHLINAIFNAGSTGVQIFFVLSGFLITYLIISEIQNYGKLNLVFFYIRRFLRIWPLYFLVVFFCIFLEPEIRGFFGMNPENCINPVYYYTFLSNFDCIRTYNQCPQNNFMSLGVLWSVSIEEQFYLFWPLFFCFFKNKLLIAVTFIFICIVFRIVNIDKDWAFNYFHTLSVIGDLAVGGAMAVLIRSYSRFRNFIENLNKRVIILIYVLFLVLYIFNDKLLYPYTFSYAVCFHRIFFDVFWAFIILEQNFSKFSIFKLGRLKWCSKMGKYTYGLYMLHPIAILSVEILIKLSNFKFSNIVHAFILLLFALPLSMILSWISYNYFEKYFLQFKEKFSFIKTTQ